MSKVECPSCAMQIDADHKTCPVCGYELTTRRSGLKWIAILLAIFLLLIYMLF
jgi:RNA polymerase subunit RPABC4/transcription elongation factor Spt4